MADSTGQPMLEVGIGADITQLQASLIAAENELRGFQSEIKKTTDTGRIAELSQSIETTKQKIAGLNAEINKSPKKFGDATNALGNLSRVAQDAPYGFIGIANNLNPLLESFQRLSKTEGGTKKALGAMAAGLTGPAGIGIALSVVSSLLVAFGDDIGLFIDKATGGSAALREYSNAFSGAKSAFTDAYVEVEKVNSAFDQFHNGTISKKDALDQYNSTLGKVYGTTKDIAEAEKLFIDNKDNYVQAALYRAAGQLALKKAAEEAFKQLEAQNAPQNANKASLFMGEGLGAFALSKLTGGPAITFTDVIGSQAIAKKAKEQEGVFQSIFKQFQDLANEQDKLASHSKTFGQEIDKSDPFKEYSANLKYELQNTLNDMEKYRKAFEKLDLKPILTVYDPEQDKKDEKRKQYFNKKNKELLDETKKSGHLGDFLEKDARKKAENYAIEDKKLKELTESYENFANMLAGSVTNGLMSIFDAMAAGESPLEAVGQMFANIARNIAAAVIQAAIFEAILSQFPELKAIFAASGALQSAFGGKKLAAGGITNGASIAMIGEAGPEAVLPLSKLNTFMQTSFNAGAMSGASGGSSGGQFVLRGQDLLVAINRTQKTSALKGQNISLI
jgi:hypothetical protein